MHSEENNNQALKESQSDVSLRSLAVAAAGAALSACGGSGAGGASGGGSTDPAPTITEPPSSPEVPSAPIPNTGGSVNNRFTQADTDAEAARFLLQVQMSALPSDIAEVRDQGYQHWIEQRMADDWVSGWDWLNSQGFGDQYATTKVGGTIPYYRMDFMGDYLGWYQLMAAPAQMRVRMALALSEIFVVSITGLNGYPWRSHLIAAYWDLLMQHAFGNYRDLLEDISLNPAMGIYLSARGSKRELASGRKPDENYAREVMQLFSIGLNELNLDGTLKNGVQTDVYTTEDVTGMARVFTGYDFDTSGGSWKNGNNIEYARARMVLNAADHAPESKAFLGVTIPANTSGEETLAIALDTLFNHDNTAPFICKQLIQRLITSNPSPSYVQRVAEVFVDNGYGVRGDLAAVFTAIVLDDEARAPDGLAASEFGKLREPMLRMAQWARTFGATSQSGSWMIRAMSDTVELAQSPLRAPSVFNFFRPGFVPAQAAITSGKVLPEFQIVNESSIAGYLNFLQNALANGMGDSLTNVPYTNLNGVAYTGRDVRAGWESGYEAELELAEQPEKLVERLNLLLCANQLGATNCAIIVDGLHSMKSGTDDARRKRVQAAIFMVMACPQYLVQK